MTPEEKREIIETYKWIKIKPYQPNENKSWEERYRDLEKHHLQETNFLIAKIRQLVELI